MASAMARFLYTLRDTVAAPAATNGHDRSTLAHAHEFSDRTATTLGGHPNETDKDQMAAISGGQRTFCRWSPDMPVCDPV